MSLFKQLHQELASGIADALAKWYEASITSSTIDDGLVQQAIQISRVLEINYS